jgi:hypothetical protein
MNCGDDASPSYITSYHDGPYNPSLASSASSSSASVWSDVASQSSDDSSVHSSGVGSESDIPDTYCCASQPPYQSTQQNICEANVTSAACWPKNIPTSIPSEQRQHPRRTSVAAGTRLGCPPSLVRQCDRKVTFVDSLVGKLQNAFHLIDRSYNSIPSRFLCSNRRSHMAPFVCNVQKRDGSKGGSSSSHFYSRDSPEISNKLLNITSGSVLPHFNQAPCAQARFYHGATRRCALHPSTAVRTAYVSFRAHSCIQVLARS